MSAYTWVCCFVYIHVHENKCFQLYCCFVFLYLLARYSQECSQKLFDSRSINMKEVLLRENTAHVVPVMNLSNNKFKGKNQTLVILFQFANSNSYYIYNDVHVLMLKKTLRRNETFSVIYNLSSAHSIKLST